VSQPATVVGGGAEPGATVAVRPAPPASLSGQAGVVILGRGLAFVFAFLVPVVLVRVVSQEDYGIYREALFVFSTFMPILQFGLTQSLFYFFPRREAERPALMTQTHLFLLASGTAFAILLILLREPVARYFGQPAMAEYMFWIGPFTALMVLSSTIEVLTIVEQKVRLTFWVVMGSEGLRSVLVVLVGALTRDVGMMLGALTVFSLARTVFVVYYCRRQGLTDLKAVKRPFLMEQLAYAVPFGLAGTVVTIVSSVDRFYVSRLFDSATFAVYSVGCFQLPIVTIVFTSATSVILGRMSELQKEGRLRDMLALWRSATRKMSHVSIPVTVVFAVLAREFVVGLFTDQYVEAVPIFIAFLFLIPRQAVPYGSVTRAFGLTRFILWVCFAALGVAVGLTALLVRPLGLLGPAIGVIVGMWVVTEVQVARTKSLLGVSYRELFPWGDFLRMTALATVLGAVLWFVKRAVHGVPAIIVLAVGCTVYLVAYYFFAWKLGLLRSDEIAEGRQLIERLLGRRGRSNR
jgi:O-antigen/teichoic acid export membrane protein